MLTQNPIVTRKYKVRDRMTGKEYTLDWDKPNEPTEVDVEQEIGKQKRAEVGLRETPPISGSFDYKEPSTLDKIGSKLFTPLTDVVQRTGKKVSDYIQDSPKLKLAAEVHDAIRRYPPGTTMTMPEAIGLGADSFTSPASIGTMGLGTANTVLPIAAKNALRVAETPKQITSANRLAKTAQATYLANQGVNLGFGAKGAYDAAKDGSIEGAAQALIGLGGFGLGMKNARNIPKRRPIEGDVIPERPMIGSGDKPDIDVPKTSPLPKTPTKYGSTTLQFEDDIDRALFAISNPRGTPRTVTPVMTWLQEQTGLSADELTKAAPIVRASAKEIRDNSTDEIVNIPKLFGSNIGQKTVQESKDWFEGRYTRYGGDDLVSIFRGAPENSSLRPYDHVFVGENALENAKKYGRKVIEQSVPAKELIPGDEFRMNNLDQWPRSGEARWIPKGTDPTKTTFSSNPNSTYGDYVREMNEISKKPIDRITEQQPIAQEPNKPKIKLENGKQEITLTNPNKETVAAIQKQGYTFLTMNPDKTMKFRLTGASQETPEIKTMSEQGVIGSLPSIEPQRMASHTGGGVKIGADVESLGRVLGSSLYKGSISKIVTKELMQNSLDAVRHLGDSGKVTVDLNRVGKYVQVQDNGNGLTKRELETVFTDLGSSGKRSDESAIGGFGLAKAAPLLGGERVEVKTVVLENGVYKEHSFSGTPEELLKGVNVQTYNIAPANTPGTKPETGTTVRTYMPDGTTFYEASEFIDSISRHSSGVRGKILTKQGYGEPIESSKLDLTDADVKAIQGPAADVEITVPKGTNYGPSHGVNYQILNNGMFQAKGKSGGWSELPGIPDTVLVNIKSKVPEGHIDYPFVANRESLRGTTEELVNEYIKEHIINPATGKRINQLREAYNSMPTFNIGLSRPERPFHIFDPKGVLTDRDLMMMEASEPLKRLSRLISDTLNNAVLIATTKESQAKLKKIGLVLADNTKGLHVPSPGEDSSAILINPFLIMLHKSNGPEQAAAGLLHTILHEVAHIPGGGHDEDFAIRLSHIYENYGVRNAINAQDKFLAEISDSEMPNEYNTAIQELLRRYQEYIGRAGTKEDILSGTGITNRIKSERSEGNEINVKSDGTGVIAKRNDAGELGPFSKKASKVPKNKKYDKTKADAIGQKITDALVDAYEVRAEQTKSDSMERAKRFQNATKSFNKAGGGIKGHRAALSRMSGQLPITEYEGEFQLTQEDIDTAVNSIYSSDLMQGQKFHATAGLMRLIGDGDGRAPSVGELRLLGKVFGERFTDSINEMQDAGFILNPFHKITGTANQWINLPKGVVASMDFSFPFRQGVGLIHRKEFQKAFVPMFQAWNKEFNFQEQQKLIQEHPKFEIADESGLNLSDININREENIISQLPERIPLGIGKHLVRPSNRAYMSFANKLRMDTFATMDDEMQEFLKGKLKRELWDAELDDARKKLAKYVNTVSGRGSLGKYEKIGDDLNIAFFSPRLLARNLKMVNPYTYFKPEIRPIANKIANSMRDEEGQKPAWDEADVQTEKYIRLQYLKSLSSIVALASTAIGFAYAMGAETSFDSRSPDFLKIKMGNIRLDVLGGLQQFLVEGSQIAHNTKVSGITGRETIMGSKYGTDDAMDDLYKFIESKGSPAASSFVEYMRGKDFSGRKLEFWNFMYRHNFPLVAQDLKELYKENPMAVALIIPAMFGMGVQVQKPFGSSKRNLQNVRPIKANVPTYVPRIH